MRSLLWFVLGLAGGVVAAHLVDKNPRGHEVLAQIDARITELPDRTARADREEEARVADPADAAPDAAPTTTD